MAFLEDLTQSTKARRGPNGREHYIFNLVLMLLTLRYFVRRWGKVLFLTCSVVLHFIINILPLCFSLVDSEYWDEHEFLFNTCQLTQMSTGLKKGSMLMSSKLLQDQQMECESPKPFLCDGVCVCLHKYGAFSYWLCLKMEVCFSNYLFCPWTFLWPIMLQHLNMTKPRVNQRWLQGALCISVPITQSKDLQSPQALDWDPGDCSGHGTG